MKHQLLSMACFFVLLVNSSIAGAVSPEFAKAKNDRCLMLYKRPCTSNFADVTKGTNSIGNNQAEDVEAIETASNQKVPPQDVANEVHNTAAVAEGKRLEGIKADDATLLRRQEAELKAAQEAAKARERNAKLAADKLAEQKAAEEKRLVAKALEDAKRDRQISPEAVRGVRDPKIQEHLVNAAVVQDLREDLKREERRSELKLAQLLQMAAVTMQAATAMKSMDGTNSSPSQTFDPTQSAASKAALGRSPASLGDKKGSISVKSDDPALEEGGKPNDEKSIKDKETLAKIKAEVEAAEKRKKIYGLRLKQKLRDKIKAQQGKEGAVDTDELFGGSLNRGEESAQSDQEEETAAKDSAMSASSVYQAVKEGFSLAGAETDHEVGQIVSEAERDLSSEDMSAGVLGRESPSLFARVHAVHQACQRDKCVLSRSN